jgi:WD40 repeat protein
VLGWEPWEKTTVLLKDFSDYGNANASPIPRNTLRFDVAPVSYAFETFTASERLYQIMNHEQTHVATTDIWNEQDAAWRRLFGGKVFPQWQHPETLVYSYLTVPRFTVPRWYAEGSAVFMETWMGGGLGRVQGGFYEMVFRAMVRDGAPFYDPLGLESRGMRVDFQVGANAYLYGTRFFTWLAYAHSPEKVVRWLRRDADGKRHYADQFEHVFGLTLEQAWQDWIAFEKQFQTRNLARVREHPITPHRTLVPAAVGSASRAYYDPASDTLYAGYDYQGVVAHIGALDMKSGNVRRLADIKDSLLYKVTALAWDPQARTLFYVTDNHALRDIWSVNVDTGEETLLMPDARIGEIVFNPADKSLIGVRHLNGFATLVTIAPPYTDWHQVHTFPYGIVPFDLDVSPDGKLLSASVAEVNGDQFLRVWSLGKVLAGDLKPLSEYRFGQSTPETFVFSPDGKYLYGSSYYTGVSNIFRYEVATGEVEAVSNAESGFFRPLPLPDGRLMVFSYTAVGFIPATIEPKVLKDVSAISFLGAELAEKHPVVKTWQVPAPSTVDEEKLITKRGAYVPLKSLEVQSWYPILQGYKKDPGIGVHVHIDDPLSLAYVGLNAAYTPNKDLSKDERVHLEAYGRYLGWHGGLSWNRSDFYDLFGPTIRSRRGTAGRFGYDQFLIFDEPRKLELRSEIAHYENLDALPAAQNVRATSERLTTLELGLYFANPRRSRGAVDDEKGVFADVVSYTNYVDGKVIPQVRGRFDFGIPLPWGHSSLWIRNVAGAAHGDADDPYANFFFGGFGNNYVDASRPEKRYREYDSFPGFEINEIRGRTFARSMLEANLPPYVFESAGTPVFYLAWLRTAAFASALVTDKSDPAQKGRYGNVGAQADLRFSVMHWYEMTLSVGFAQGFRGSERAKSEWMVSLKIM